MIEKIFITKILAPNGWIDFKFGVLLYIHRAYMVSDFGCCPISNFCTIGGMQVILFMSVMIKYSIIKLKKNSNYVCQKFYLEF